ncbi:MAG: Ribosomal RNA small subunit methyltransferase A [Parcubacteria group bacterium GW2011_GWC2_45_7]|nr:MAG: Ribosomal RNA small subunit methyltransferase A [Parcubacteria group bacterium GW2011_GWC2_45_7]KKU72930.1 MAG: Ribosomal RNA small subunit methyltransferase A [Parcubacteria group bacterium GW2011_GWA2_47_26]
MLSEEFNLGKIQKLCETYGIKPTKKRGQNFVIDPQVIEGMIKAANLNAEDRVLEIGPGFGVLTFEMAKIVKKILAVELDKKIVQVLATKLPGNVRNVIIQQGDALKLSNHKIVELLGEPEHYKVVSNLPYDITSAALRKFTEEKPRPSLAVFMVQKEVAERVCAKPGAMSLLSVAVQYYGKPEIVNYVPRSAFWPQPEVDSAILRIRNYELAIRDFDEKKLFQVVRIGFSSRRKQLQNNLSAGLRISREQAVSALHSVNLKSNIRAQELSVEKWVELSKSLSASL